MIRKKSIKKLILCFVFLYSLNPVKIQAGAGKSFGLFAGGAIAGSLITSAVKDRKRNRNEPTYIQTERVIEKPVYVQQPPTPVQTRSTYTSPDTEHLKSRVYEQDERIRRLEQELRKERKEATKREKQLKTEKPTKQRLEKDIFDEWDTETNS